MSVLNEICARKAKHVEACKATRPLVEIKAKLTQAPKPRGFIQALKSKPAPAIICEIKKASPSKGIIRDDFDPEEIAKIYQQNGASCLSVLTDEPYFQGADEYLTRAQSVSSLPALRKDFMVDEYQIYESRALGADCVLLIMAALSDDQARRFYDIATDLGMDVLVEVHDKLELERAISLSPAMIGVNNRNLKTLKVDINTSQSFAAQIPDDILKIAESGLSTRENIQTLIQSGYQGFLIGESLMRAQNIGAALSHLLEKY